MPILPKSSTLERVIPIIIILITLCSCNDKQINDSRPKLDIGLVYIIDHPSIQQGVDGFESYVDTSQFFSAFNVNVNKQSAFGEIQKASTVIQSYINNDYDIIVALTTPIAQVANNLVDDIPLIFVGVSDPIAAGLVDSNFVGKKNVTGTMSSDPYLENISLFKSLYPEHTRIGVIYSLNEINSQTIVSNLKKLDEASDDFEMFIVGINESSELDQAYKSLTSKVDAFYMINDNLVASNVKLIVNLASRNGDILFASDVESVRNGAKFTLGLNYSDEGSIAAGMVVKILSEKLEDINRIPIYVNKSYYPYINKDTYTNMDTSLIQGFSENPIILIE